MDGSTEPDIFSDGMTNPNQLKKRYVTSILTVAIRYGNSTTKNLEHLLADTPFSFWGLTHLIKCVSSKKANAAAIMKAQLANQIKEYKLVSFSGFYNLK